MRCRVLVLFAAVAVAEGQESAEWVAHNLATSIRNKTALLKGMTADLNESALETLEGHPKYVLQVCASLASHLPAAVEYKNLTAWHALCDFAVKLSDRCLALAPDSAVAKRAAADARFARARLAPRTAGIDGTEDRTKAIPLYAALEPAWIRYRDSFYRTRGRARWRRGLGARESWKKTPGTVSKSEGADPRTRPLSGQGPDMKETLKDEAHEDQRRRAGRGTAGLRLVAAVPLRGSVHFA
ncbi:MAG: hypothetical protein ACYTGN_01240 [Planctomycetota bacterium]|jgi:hypothetical protein